MECRLHDPILYDERQRDQASRRVPCASAFLTSVTNSGGSVAPVISMACQTIDGTDLGRASISTPHTCAAAPSPIAANVPTVMRDIRPYRVCHARTGRPRAAIAVRKCRFHVWIVAQRLQQARPWGRDSLRPTAPWHDARPRRGCAHRRAARQIGKHHAIATAAAIRCVIATPPSSSMCRGRVLHLRHPGERWRGSPRPARCARPASHGCWRGVWTVSS